MLAAAETKNPFPNVIERYNPALGNVPVENGEGAEELRGAATVTL